MRSFQVCVIATLFKSQDYVNKNGTCGMMNRVGSNRFHTTAKAQIEVIRVMMKLLLRMMDAFLCISEGRASPNTK